MRFFLLLFIFLMPVIACKKSENSGTQEDCQTKNYGIYRVNFTSSTLSHHVSIAYGSGSIEKNFNPGVLTDTMHLPPGTYFVIFLSLDRGTLIDTASASSTILQCKETVKSLPFQIGKFMIINKVVFLCYFFLSSPKSLFSRSKGVQRNVQ